MQIQASVHETTPSTHSWTSVKWEFMCASEWARRGSLLLGPLLLAALRGSGAGLLQEIDHLRVAVLLGDGQGTVVLGVDGVDFSLRNDQCLHHLRQVVRGPHEQRRLAAHAAHVHLRAALQELPHGGRPVARRGHDERTEAVGGLGVGVGLVQQQELHRRAPAENPVDVHLLLRLVARGALGRRQRVHGVHQRRPALVVRAADEGVPAEKVRHDVSLAVVRSAHEGRAAVAVHLLQPRPASQQLLHQSEVAALGAEGERRLAIAGRHLLHAGPALDEPGDSLAVALDAGPGESREAVVVLCGDVRLLPQEPGDSRGPTLCGGHVQGRGARLVAGLEVRALPDEVLQGDHVLHVDRLAHHLPRALLGGVPFELLSHG
mmetsp:Transcript_32738/g.102158  ORF Transcript_32738/g.102158 Transcript_32738/m.102158 type:complete len:376 (+) Transcript_32738:78-1205(+)